MTLKKLSRHTIFIPIFERVLTIVKGDYEAVASFIKKSQNVDLQPCLGAYTNINGQHYLLLTENATLSTILHELLHATYGMIDRVGADSKDEELFCYFYGFLVKETFTTLKLPAAKMLDETI